MNAKEICKWIAIVIAFLIIAYIGFRLDVAFTKWKVQQ